METSTAATFAAGLALGAGAVYLASRHQRSAEAAAGLAGGPVEPADWRSSAPALLCGGGTADGSQQASVARFEEDDILSEQLTRNVQFFGLEGQRAIAGAFVVVIGLGGVGSHAAHLLLRSGVGRLRLVDFDQVTLSTLNRHCLATRADVGTPKATCLARHFADILPEAEVEAVVEMYAAGREEALLGGRPDFVLDAIDNIDTKVALLAACHARGLRVLSSAGAGAKADPTRVRIVDVGESAADPLARAVRTRLRRDHGIEGGIPVLMSTERPRCGLVYGGEEGSNPADYQVVPNFRIRTIPVLGTTPAIFGLAAAAHILCELAGAPFVPEPCFHIQDKQMATQYDRLERREVERYGGTAGLAVDLSEVEVLVREVWRGCSARAAAAGAPPADRGLGRRTGHLALTRWDASQPATVDNLVLLAQAEADAHDALAGGGLGLEALRRAEPEFCARVEAGLARARDLFLISP